MSNGEMTTRLVHSGFTRSMYVIGISAWNARCKEAGRQAGWLAGWLAASIITHLCVISIFVFQQAIISLRVGRADSLVEQ